LTTPCCCISHFYNKGTIDIDEFFKCIHERHTAFGDAIFGKDTPLQQTPASNPINVCLFSLFLQDLIDCDDSGVLDFSEFVTACGTYCMFGPAEVLKVRIFTFLDPLPLLIVF
jgi:hypothetical protein